MDSSSREAIATIPPSQISYDKSTGVFHFPLHLANPEDDMVYQAIIYLKSDPNSIPYEQETQAELEAPDADCIPVTTWVLNLQGFGPADGDSTQLELHAEDDIFSQSSSRNMEEEMSKTYARRSLGLPEKEPLSDIKIAIGKGSLGPSDGLEANHFMPQERHERVTAYNFNIWFSRAAASDDEGLVIEDILILAGPEPEPSPPEGYEVIPQDLTAIADDEPKDIGELTEEFHAFLCLKVKGECPIITTRAWQRFQLTECSLAS